MKKDLSKKVYSLILSLAMVITMMPMLAFGVYADEDIPEEVVEELVVPDAEGELSEATAEELFAGDVQSETPQETAALSEVTGEDVCKIDDTGYATLAKAVEAANAGDTIVLLKDITLSSTQTINKSITIDFGSYKISSASMVFDITAAALGLKNATIESDYIAAVEFETAATLSITGANKITATGKYYGVYVDEGLAVVGQSQDSDTLEVDVPGGVCVFVSGDDFTINNATVKLNGSRGINFLATQDIIRKKLSLDIIKSKLISGEDTGIMINAYLYNGALEYNIEDSIVEGYGFISAKTDSENKNVEDVIVNIKNSRIKLENSLQSDCIGLMATTGDAILTIDNSELDLTHNNEKCACVNVGANNEKDGHGMSKAIVKNGSVIKINGKGNAGFNIWTSGADNTKSSILDVDDSSIDIVSEKAIGLSAYTQGKAADTIVTVDNSSITSIGAEEGIQIGMAEEEQAAYKGAVSFAVNNSVINTEGTDCGFLMAANGSPFDIKYVQNNSNVTANGKENGIFLWGGTEEENTKSKTEAIVSGGSLTANDVLLTGDKTADLTLNTNAHFTGKNGAAVIGKTVNIADGKYILDGKKPVFDFTKGNLSGGHYNIKPDAKLIVKGKAAIDDTPEYKASGYNYFIGIPGTTESFRAVASGKKAIQLTWPTEDACMFVVYGSACGKGNQFVKLAELTDASSFLVTEIYGAPLKKNTAYKFYIEAYRTGRLVDRSVEVHAYTTGYKGKYGNVTKMTAKTKKLTVKAGKKAKKTIKVKAKRVKGKKFMPKSHGPQLRYVSSNPSVATVTKKGKVKGISRGTAVVYTYSINGFFCTTQVTVK